MFPTLVTRKLKRLGDIVAPLEWVGRDNQKVERNGMGVRSTVNLRSPDPSDSPGTSAAASLAPASWKPEERETLGFKLLARELKRTRGLTLSDLRKQPNVGADAIDENSVYYELKVTLGPMADTVSLTLSEFERAKAESENFILVVICGMESGYETRMKLIPDPLEKLTWSPEVDIQVSGIRDT